METTMANEAITLATEVAGGDFRSRIQTHLSQAEIEVVDRILAIKATDR